MSTSAIIMMAVSLIVIWGGLLVSVLRLPKEYTGRTAFSGCLSAQRLGSLKSVKPPLDGQTPFAYSQFRWD